MIIARPCESRAQTNACGFATAQPDRRNFIDHGEKTQALEGLLAFQIHRGPAMKVQIKDVMLKGLPDGGVVAFDEAKLPAGAAPLEKAKPKGKQPPKGAANKSAAPNAEPSATSVAPDRRE